MLAGTSRGAGRRARRRRRARAALSAARKHDQQKVGDREQGESRGETPRLTKRHGIGPDAVAPVAFEIAHLVDQVAAAEGEREKAPHREAAGIDRAEYRITQKEMQQTTGKAQGSTRSGTPFN